ncbi:MAG: hypothetical protein ACLFSP_09915 [Spirochaetaceae bacterium]
MKSTLVMFIAFLLLIGGGLAAAQSSEEEFDLSVDTFLQNRYPMGSYADYVSTGVGAGTQLNVHIESLGGVIPYMGIDYSYGFSEVDYVDHIQDFGITLGAGYPFALTEEITVVPELGYGLMLHRASGDIEGSSNKGYADQALRSGVKGLYALGETVELYLAPTYTLFLEEEEAGMELGYQLGARFNF